MYMYIYKIVSLLKSYDNIHGMTYTAKIMLSGIAKIKTGYFDELVYGLPIITEILVEQD